MEKFWLKVFKIILKSTLGVWLRLTYHVKADNSEIKEVKPPYIFVSNHCLNWDPFTTPLYIKHSIHWMASDNLFRSKIIGFLLTHLVGAFSKKKAVADTSSIKQSIRLIRDNRIVGIFPEGSRTWNGKSVDVLYSTAKFIKFLKVPVVMCEQRGCYLSRPRWAAQGRAGKMFLRYYVLMDQDYIKNSTLDEIYESLNNAIAYNESDWQKEHMIEYKSKANAEFLELYLYVCPKCHSISTLQSNKHELTCTHCHMKVTLNNYGYFEGDDKCFDDVVSWGEWQYTYIKEYINHHDHIFTDDQVIMKSEKKNNSLDKGVRGKLELFKNQLVFTAEKEQLIFDINVIFGNTIQLNWIFEFYYNGEFRRFYFYPKSRVSAYKWNEATEYLKQIGGKNNGK